MKKILLSSFSISLVLISVNLFSNESGAPNGYTGAPNESTCAINGCHGGSPNTGSGSASISVEGNPTGYTPGQVYNIHVTVSETGRSIFGFSLVAKQSSNAKAGSLGVNSGDNTYQVFLGYATHTFSGRAGSTDTKTWVVKWTAPSSNVGTVTFYVGGNAANGDRTMSGDNIYTTSLQLPALSSGIAELASDQSFSIYPVPAHDRFTIKYDLKATSKVAVSLVDLSGKEVATLINEEEQSQGTKEIPVQLGSQVNKGIYLVKFSVDGTSSFRKIFVN